MYLLLKALKDVYSVYDTETQSVNYVPKTLTQVSGVVNEYIHIPYSDYEIRLSQLIKLVSITNCDTSNFGYSFDRTSLLCVKQGFDGELQYVSIFGYILNNWDTNMIVSDNLVINIADACVTFSLLDKEKFLAFITKFKVFNKEIKTKSYRYEFNEHLTVYEGNKIVFTTAKEKN